MAADGVGRFLAETLEPLLTGPGTFVLLLALGILSIMLAFNLRLRQLTDPVTGTAHWVVTTAAGDSRPPHAGRSRGGDHRCARQGQGAEYRRGAQDPGRGRGPAGR